MARYYDAENVIDAIKSLFHFSVNNVAVVDVDEAMATVYAIPTADVRENRKGKWYAIGNTNLATCECGYITDRYSAYNYCPNCGADMRKGEDVNG